METEVLLPSFVLKDQHKNDFVLKAYTRQLVLLSFHPLAWTGVCAEQMKALEASIEAFEEKGVTVVGVSVDTIPSKLAWAENLSIKKLRLLSDFWPHGAVAKQFDIFREKEGFSERANILLGAEQVVLWKKVYPISELPDLTEVFQVISTIKY